MQIFLVPPVSGLHPPVLEGFAAMQRVLIDRGHNEIHIVEFAGQRERAGKFSLVNSCRELEAQVRQLSEPGECFIFGVCSGAVAGLWAACHATVQGVLCWEMSQNYRLTRSGATALSRKYKIRLDWESVLIPINPLALVRSCKAPLVFGYSPQSRSTNEAEQMKLAEAARMGTARAVPCTGHFPGYPIGSSEALADLICDVIKTRCCS